MGPIGTTNFLPALHLGLVTLPLGLRLLRLGTAGRGRVDERQVLPYWSEGLLGLSQTAEEASE